MWGAPSVTPPVLSIMCGLQVSEGDLAEVPCRGNVHQLCYFSLVLLWDK
jgi:hypothetical protein